MEPYRVFIEELRLDMEISYQKYLVKKNLQLESLRQSGSDDDSDWQYENYISNLEPTNDR